MVEDKQGNNTLPGEIVGVRSQRSCWVRMEGSDRIFLRNRRFLERDPSFNSQRLNMLRHEAEYEGMKAAEFSTRRAHKPTLRSSWAAAQPGGGKSVSFADLTGAEPVAAAALGSSVGEGGHQPGAKVTFADIVKGSSSSAAADSLLPATGARAGPEQLATEAGQQEGKEVVALRRDVASLKEKIEHLEALLRARL